MASSVPATVELELLKTLAECPICYEIPRDGVMFQCVNGHNVCATCKDQLAVNTYASHLESVRQVRVDRLRADPDLAWDAGRNVKCPQCRCRFTHPPARNLTVTGLIDRLPFEFPCRNVVPKTGNHSSCAFKGTNDVLERHEIVCVHRSVQCFACDVFLSVDRVVEHFEEVHKESVTRMGAYSDRIELRILWKPDFDTTSSLSWMRSPFEYRAGFVFPCLEVRDDLVYFWLLMLADSSVTDGLRCQIRLDGPDLATRANGPVYPIDWDRDRIMEDNDCVRISRWSINKIMTNEVTEEEKHTGCLSCFKATFRIIVKQAA